MKLTNKKIYEYATNLVALNIDGKLPVRLSFFLQKNIQQILTLGQEIDEAKMKLGQQYGEPNAEGGFYIPADRVELVNQELTDLMNLEQDVNLHVFKLEDFDNIELTYKDLSSIMFMIEE